MRVVRKRHRPIQVCLAVGASLLAALALVVLAHNHRSPQKTDGLWLLPGTSAGSEFAPASLRSERFAWVTSLYDGGDRGFLEMLFLMIRTLRMHGGHEELIILTDGSVKNRTIFQELSSLGGHEVVLPPVEVPDWVAATIYRKSNIRNFHRLHLWNLTDYDRLAYIDADMFFVANVEPIRRLPCFSGASQRYGMINGGMMVLCPEKEVATDMVRALWEDTGGWKYREAEQTFFSEYFARRGELNFVSTCYNARAEDYRPWLRAFYRRNSFGRFWPTRDVCAYQDAVLMHFNGPLKPWMPYARVELAPEIWGLYVDTVVRASGASIAVPPLLQLESVPVALTNDTAWLSTVQVCCKDETCKRICPYYGL